MLSRKAEMIQRLRSHNVLYEDDMKKCIYLHKSRFPLYVIDEIAKEYRYRVIRLPPYHCHFNTIELIWAQIKGHVARINKKFNIR